jgi:hypothetical protein
MRKSILVLFLFFVVREGVWEIGQLVLILRPQGFGQHCHFEGSLQIPRFARNDTSKGDRYLDAVLGLIPKFIRLKAPLIEPGVRGDGAESGSAEGMPQAAGDFILAGAAES